MSTSVEKVDTNFLPLIYTIIKGLVKFECPPFDLFKWYWSHHHAFFSGLRIEKESLDSGSQKSAARDPTADCNQKIAQLREKLQKAREHISKVPGIDSTVEEQLIKIDALKRQYIMKQELLMKYKHHCPIEMPLK